MRLLKTMSKVLFGLLAIVSFSILSSCAKPAGPGGQSTITGKIWVEDWNTGFTVKNGEYAGADVDVYIIYGSEVGYGDRTRANYNGEFEFKYLRIGKYKIYVYSKDKTLQSPSGSVAVVKEIEITKTKETITTEQFTIYN